MKHKKLRRKMHFSKLGGVSVVMLAVASIAMATGFPCATPPTMCDADVLDLNGQMCRTMPIAHWTIVDEGEIEWWGCSGSANCSGSSPSSPGMCNVMTVTTYPTVSLKCGNSSTRYCVIGGGSPEPSPNRTCDNTPCASGPSTAIPTLGQDVCNGAWFTNPKSPLPYECVLVPIRHGP
jgi:hypothetical protein